MFEVGSKNIKRIISNLKNLNLVQEFTVEILPQSWSSDFLQELFNMGVNRLNINAISTNERVLKWFGQTYNKDVLEDLIKTARKIGFKNIDIDFTFAIENQTIRELNNDIDFVEDNMPEHVNFYQYVENKNFDIKPIDDLSEMWTDITKDMVTIGYEHYEITSFSLSPEFYSKQMMVYWNSNEWDGIGINATSFIREHDGYHYIDVEGSVEDFKTVDSIKEGKQLAEQVIMMALNKKDGINITNPLHHQAYEIYKDKINDLIDRGFLVKSNYHIFIPKTYFHRMGEIINNILDI